MDGNLTYSLTQWIEAGGEVFKIKEKLKNDAAGVNYINEFATCINVAFNDASRPLLADCYEKLTQSRNLFSSTEKGDIDEFVSQGRVLFVERDYESNFDEIKQFLSKRMKKAYVFDEGPKPEPKPEPTPEPTPNPRPNDIDEEKRRRKEERERKRRKLEEEEQQQKQNEQAYEEETRRKDEERRKKTRGKEQQQQKQQKRNRRLSKLLSVIFAIFMIIFLLSERGCVRSIKSTFNKAVYSTEQTDSKKTTKKAVKKKVVKKKGATKQNTKSTKKTTKKTAKKATTQKSSSSTSAKLKPILTDLNKKFKKGSDGKSAVETAAEYGAMDALRNINSQLKKAEKIDKNNKQVKQYRTRFNSILKKYKIKL